MSLSLLIVSWNTCDLLRQCLRSVYETTSDMSDVEIVVVDNASTDGSSDMVHNEFPLVKIIDNTNNTGFAVANNQALRICQGEQILLLNPDTVVMPDCIQNLVAAMRDNPAVGIVAPRLTYGDGCIQPSTGQFPSFMSELLDALYLGKLNRKWSNCAYSFSDRTDNYEVDWACGACLLIRRSALSDKDKLFDERYCMFSEEMDLCKSITEAEWKILLVPRAMVVHYGSGSTSQVAVPMFARRYESKYVYFAKHHGVLTANAFRFVVIPVYCVVRLLLFPSIWLITRKRYRDSNLSPLMYLNLLRDIFKWSSSEQVALTEGGSCSSV